MATIPETPPLGDPLEPCYPSTDTLHLLSNRRSTTADLLGGPGPDAAQLKSILTIAARAPDHRRVAPFRFILFEGEGRSRAGEIIAQAFRHTDPASTPERVEKERARFERAPVVIGVLSCVDYAHRTPEWEQVLTAGAVCQNALIAANAFGFAAQWLTEWYAFDANVNRAFGLSENERIAGYIYIGTAKENPKERARPNVEALVSRF